MGTRAGMTLLTRLRRTERTILKAQRRLWLLQIALWPTLVLTVISMLAAGAWWFLRRNSAPPQPAPAGRHEAPNPATNGQLTHT
jgi:hypothetical protein